MIVELTLHPSGYGKKNTATDPTTTKQRTRIVRQQINRRRHSLRRWRACLIMPVAGDACTRM